MIRFRALLIVAGLVLRHVVKDIRARWPRVEILVRGDSHYARHEALVWCERNRVGYVFGLAGNQAGPALKLAGVGGERPWTRPTVNSRTNGSERPRWARSGACQNAQKAARFRYR